MKDIDHFGKANGVDGPVGIAVLIIDHLKNASAAKTLQGLGTRVLIAVLRIVDRKTHDPANLVGERPQVGSGRSDPFSGLWCSHSGEDYSSRAIGRQRMFAETVGST